MENKTEKAINILRCSYIKLNRIPKKSDFDDATVCLIKQVLGPWPRALEKAGLKENVKISAKEKSKLKRERIKKRNKRSNNEDA